MAGEGREGPVADFCAGLKRLQQGSGLGPEALARRLGYSRSQLYEILDGRISRPPEWDRLVEPLVRACTGNSGRAVAEWRRRHDLLVGVYNELQRQRRRDGQPRPGRAGRVVPAQLPADVRAFTGRSKELADLDSLIAAHGPAAGGGSTAVVISAVSGTAGVGKSALAVRWAHRVRRRFPDGQLYINLRGYDPEQPMPAGDALVGFLHALGVAGQDIPPEEDERAASYRTLLDGRRMLVVLDNAATVEQIRLLLPGSPSCLVVVTSRDSLAGLVALHGAHRLDLDLLPLAEAVALLRALIGGRVDAELESAATLARQCARLPLALRIAAELAVARPSASLADLVGELADLRRRLDLLDAGGDPRAAVGTVFSWSYQHLPADARRAFRLLGLHPGPDLDPYAAAALADTGLQRAQHLLGLLARVHLVHPTSPGRYGMHDLLRGYAIHLTHTEDSEQDQRAALARLFDHYLAAAAVAMDILHPADQHRRPRIQARHAPAPPMADSAAALAWLDAERAALAAACAHTAAHGWPGHTTDLAATLFRYLDVGGHITDALAIHSHARDAAGRTGDRAGEAHALTNLGAVYYRQGRYEQAADHYQRALTVFREISDQVGEARALGNLGLVYWGQGRYEQAADHHRQVLTLYRDIGDRVGEARALTNLGAVYWRQGRYEQAADHYQQAITVTREIGDRGGEAEALTNLGAVYWRQGRYEQAADHHEQALSLAQQAGDRAGEANALDGLGRVLWRQGRDEQAANHYLRALTVFQETGDRGGEAEALTNLGLLYGRQGRYEQAADHHEQALTIFRDHGDREGEARALNGVGESQHASGQPDQARVQHTAALALAVETGDRYEQAHAHDGLAHIYHTIGDSGQARRHWQQALTLYTDLGVPEADDIRTHLTELDHSAGEDK